MRKSKIIVCKGPMFAGKSTETVRRIKSLDHSEIQFGLLVIKHSFDDRYSKTNVVTHDNETYNAYPTNKLLDVVDYIKKFRIKHIFIDEGQFFDDLVDFCQALHDIDCVITVSGLDYTFNKEPFRPIKELSELADEVISLTATCSFCGKDAIYSKLLVEKPVEGNVVIGGADKYKPSCSNCM